jgi:hypothetical protein
MVKWPKLLWSFDCLSAAVRRRLSHPAPWRHPPALAIMRAKGRYALPEYRAWVAPRLTARRQRLVPWLMALIPGPLINWLVLAFFAWRRPHDLFTLRELRDSRYHWPRPSTAPAKASRERP